MLFRSISEQARPLLLPQEVKELGESKAIITLTHTKPILCDKARFYDDPIFMDRLKEVSPSLAALGRRMPTQTELEEAAFVKRELAVEIPWLDVDLHRAKVERRIRPLQQHEPIDLSTLAMDLSALPPVLPHDPPAVGEVTQLVDAFFAQLDWTDKKETVVSGVEQADSGSHRHEGERQETTTSRQAEDEHHRIESTVTDAETEVILIDQSQLDRAQSREGGRV